MPAGTPAQWIWDFFASGPTTVYFRRTFTPIVSTATITVGADDNYQMWVNGQLISTGNNWQQSTATLVTLNPGVPNLIAVAVTNTGGAGGLILDMR